VKVKQQDEQELLLVVDKEEIPEGVSEEEEIIIDSKPEQKFAVFQKVLAKDTTTPLLYEAVVRKIVFAPKSKKVIICLLESTEETIDDDNLDAIMDQEAVYSWHYFVHYLGWNVKWDRWVDEDQLFDNTEGARVLAKRLKEESKCLKRGASKKKVIETMQRIVRLEQELKEKQARGESIEFDVDAVKVNIEKEKPKKESSTDGKEGVTQAFLSREIGMRKKDLTSRNCSISLPFSLKKILTDDWEIITQCGMLHSLPAPLSVMDALNAYYKFKMKALHPNEESTQEEKKDDGIKVDALAESDETSDDGDNHREWKEMVNGIALFFDQALPKRLLFRHEIPQCLLLEENYEKRYCELYPSEYLIRMCIKLPDLLDESKHISEEEKSKILFKIGDLLRFLNRHHDLYFLQRYRKATAEEEAKAQRLQKRLGLGKENKEDEDAAEAIGTETVVEEEITTKKKRKSRAKAEKGSTIDDTSESVITEIAAEPETISQMKNKAQSKGGRGKKKKNDNSEIIGSKEATESKTEIASKKKQRKAPSKTGKRKKSDGTSQEFCTVEAAEPNTLPEKKTTARKMVGRGKASNDAKDVVNSEEAAELETATATASKKNKRRATGKVGKGKKSNAAFEDSGPEETASKKRRKV
jgi:mortality factor 4-like protein 1